MQPPWLLLGLVRSWLCRPMPSAGIRCLRALSSTFAAPGGLPPHRRSGMWRSVAIGVVLAGALAGCGVGEDDASMSGAVGISDALSGKPALARYRACLIRHGATVESAPHRKWMLTFKDGHSATIDVPETGFARQVLPWVSTSTPTAEDLNIVVACVRGV